MPNSFAHLYMVEPTPRARRLLWHLLSVGSVTLDEPDCHEALEKPGAHLFWVQSGKGTLDVPGKTYSLQTGPRCWLVDMRKPRTYAPLPGKKITNIGFRFGGPDLEAWRDELSEDNQFVIPSSELEAIRKAVQSMSHIVKRRPAGFEWEIHVLITQILGKLLNARQVFSAPQFDVPKALTRAISLVMANPLAHWQVPDLARAAGASRSGLQRMFRIYQQESIHEFLLRTRLDQARQLLCDDRLAIKEVSNRLNFSSEFYFSRFFRKKTGMSPTQFRESIKV